MNTQPSLQESVGIPAHEPSELQNLLQPRRSVLAYEACQDPIQWRDGERLDGLFEARCQQLIEEGKEDHIALQFDGHALTYLELDERANQLAHYLQKQGIAPGDRVGHMFEKTPETYISLLAIMKLGATFLPFDTSTPVERLRFMIEDGDITAMLSMSSLAQKFETLAIDTYCLDSLATETSKEPGYGIERAPIASDSIAYIIYTSGTTGHPKGVAINHSSICNFVRVASRAYGYQEEDRVYQGMTLAFDFSFEEVFVPLIAGSTLIPSPGGLMLGDDLWTFLNDMKVTAMCCVPTLLASINEDLEHLRLILLGGEATPHDLVVRWDRPERLILNTYGPTEATITATAGPMVAERPVTIGVPLPTYSIAILEPDCPALVPYGEIGEICIGGIGLAVGYLNLQEKTDEKFIPDFLGLPNNTSGKIYRTGDLGRITEEGEVEYLGRIDTQVKLRGYRIELTEIESVLLEHESIAQAVVDAKELACGQKELVAYYTLKPGVESIDRGEVFSSLSERMPIYMVPSYMERLDEIPMLPSNKVNRKILPLPTSQRLVARRAHVTLPQNALEKLLVGAFQEALQIPECSTDAHFFSELGANSLGLARFASEVRRLQADLALTIRDCYEHPSIQELAAHLASKPKKEVPFQRTATLHRPSRLSYVMTGVMQYAVGTAAAYFGFWLLIKVALWLLAAYGTSAIYVRAIVFTGAFFGATTIISVAAKWTLIGRYKAEEIPLWSFKYFRFWLAGRLIGLNPLVAFSGTPVYNLYLKMLGAKVSLSAVIESSSVPFCTDLLTIGPRAVLRKAVLVHGYKVQNNVLKMGPVTIGEGAYIGVGSVIDIHTTIGEYAQLAHSSSVEEGQTLAAHTSYHGSPAIETDTKYAQLESEGSVVLRGFLYAAIFSLPLVVGLPLFIAVASYTFETFALTGKTILFFETFSLMPLQLLPGIVGVLSALFVVGIFTAMLAVVVWPRLYNLFLTPGKTYKLFGIHHFLFRTVRGLSNSRFLNTLFGDSSLITTYLRAIGYNLNTVIQTGSNFGSNQLHDTPYLCDIGTGTMVSDGLSMVNLNLSATSFRIEPTTLQEHCFLGNDVRVLPESKVGKNCLLATKVLIPIDGEVRENVGLLGSPAFEIPRIVERDVDLLSQFTPEEKAARLRRKNWSNLATAMCFLFSSWLFLNVAFVMLIFSFYAFITGGFLPWFGVGSFFLAYTILHFTFAERVTLGFGRMKAGMFSIYDPEFWAVERYWKMSSFVSNLFRGTPLCGTMWRLSGVKVGRMLYDGGVGITERTLVTLGDYCNLNAGSNLQSHSLEDGAFKCQHIHVGDGCNLMPGSFVHYGVEMQDYVTVESDAFLMKGQRPEASSVWRGNPAIRV